MFRKNGSVENISKEIVTLKVDIKEGVKNITRMMLAKKSDKKFDAKLYKDQQDIKLRQKYLRKFRRLQRRIFKSGIEVDELSRKVRDDLRYIVNFIIVVDEDLKEALKRNR